MTTQHYFIQTNRLGFRRWRQDDLAIALGLWGDIKVTRLIDARGRLSSAQVQERLEQEIAGQREHGLQYWPLFLLESNEHVGCCGLRPYDLPGRVYEIGFHIRSEQWRRGFAFEAATAVVEFAFSNLNAIGNRNATGNLNAAGLFAGHNPQNEASRLLLQKLGFRYTHDEYYPATGLNHPSYFMAAAEYARLDKP